MGSAVDVATVTTASRTAERSASVIVPRRLPFFMTSQVPPALRVSWPPMVRSIAARVPSSVTTEPVTCAASMNALRKSFAVRFEKTCGKPCGPRKPSTSTAVCPKR